VFWKSKPKAVKMPEPDTSGNKRDVNCVLYSNNFEQDFSGWKVRGSKKHQESLGKHTVTIALSSDESHSGSSSLFISGRRSGWNGVAIDVTKYIKESVLDYECQVWIKLKPEAKSCIVHLSMEVISILGGVLIPKYYYMDDYSREDGILSKYRLPVGTFDADDVTKPANDYPHNPKNITDENNWVLLQSKLHVRKCNINSVIIYIETDEDGAENDIYIDDFVLLTDSSSKK
jgi:hypothetical protein